MFLVFFYIQTYRNKAIKIMNIINTILVEPIIGFELITIILLCTYIVRDCFFTSQPSQISEQRNTREYSRKYPRKLGEVKIGAIQSY